MKKQIALGILLMVALISGCGRAESIESSAIQTSEAEVTQHITAQKDEKNETINAEEQLAELNYTRADVKYEEEFPVKLIL